MVICISLNLQKRPKQVCDGGKKYKHKVINKQIKINNDNGHRQHIKMNCIILTGIVNRNTHKI